MRKRRVLFLAAVGIAAVVGLYMFLTREKEPTYSGHSLSYWLPRSYAEGGHHREAGEAIAQMGTNAVPFMVRWIGYKPPRWRTWLIDVREKTTVHGWHCIPAWVVPRRKFQRAEEAFTCLANLRPGAELAVPLMGRVVRNPGPLDHRKILEAMLAIGSPSLPEFGAILIDTNATPTARLIAISAFDTILRDSQDEPGAWTNAAWFVRALTRNANDPDPMIAAKVAITLGMVKKLPTLTVPALTSALTNSDKWVRQAAAEDLARLRLASYPALPALLKATTDPDAGVRAAASRAVLEFPPQQLTNAPTQ